MARAVAILGMFAVHLGPTDDTSVTGRLYAMPHGRASLLFVLVAGIGVSLMASSPSRSRRTTRVTLLWRAALLLPTGLALQLLDHGINVILQSYALLFVVAMLAIGLSDRWLLWLTAAGSLVGPIGVLVGQINAPEVFARDPLELTDPFQEVGLGLLVSGPYPVAVWSVPLLFGIWLGRRDLRDRGLWRRTTLVGFTVAAGCLAVSEVVQRSGRVPLDEATPGKLLLATPHSQMPLWVIGGTASAVAVVGASLWFAERLPRTSYPLAATGALALTVYVGHLVALHLAPGLRSDDVGRASLVLVAGGLVVIACSALWHRSLGPGPLERLLRLPAPLGSRLVRDDATPDDP